MAKTPEPTSKAKRTKFLNVIYFVDANKTRTFKLTIAKAYLLLAVVILVILWAVLGSAFLVREVNFARFQTSRIHFLLGTLFQYQTRYEEVYEKAYPQNPKKPGPADPPDDDDEQIASAETSDKEPGEKKSEISLSAKNPPPTPEAKETPDTTSGGIDISVENIRSAPSGSNLAVNFDIRNKNKGDKVSGYMWGVAQFIDAAGSKQFLAVPSSVKISEAGETLHYKTGYRFNIRYFKPSTITFIAPPDKEGHFADALLYIADESGEKVELKVPISQSTNGTADAMPLRRPPPPKPQAKPQALDAEPANTESLAQPPRNPGRWLPPPESAPPNQEKNKLTEEGDAANNKPTTPTTDIDTEADANHYSEEEDLPVEDQTDGEEEALE